MIGSMKIKDGRNSVLILYRYEQVIAAADMSDCIIS